MSITRHLDYASVTAVLALVVATSSGAYAEARLGANSVGTAQLQNDAVTSAKVRPARLLAEDFAAGELTGPPGSVGPPGVDGPQGADGPRGPQGPKGDDAGDPGRGVVGSVTTTSLLATFDDVSLYVNCDTTKPSISLSFVSASSATPLVYADGVVTTATTYPASGPVGVAAISRHASSDTTPSGSHYAAFLGMVQADFSPPLYVNLHAYEATISSGPRCFAEGTVTPVTH